MGQISVCAIFTFQGRENVAIAVVTVQRREHAAVRILPSLTLKHH